MYLYLTNIVSHSALTPIMTAELQINQLPPVPIMHWLAFAKSVGLEEEVVRGLCGKGHLPTIRLGKHRFINLAKLQQMCLEGEEP